MNNKLKRIIIIWQLLYAPFAFSQKAPGFTITDIEGHSWNLYTELSKGKVVVLDFFFADCTPCQKYTPEMVKIYEDYGLDTGKVLILGISDRDNNLKLEEFDTTYKVNYPSAGVEGGGDNVTELYKSWYSFMGWPTYAIICTDSTIQWDIERNTGLPELRAAIDKCISTGTGISENELKHAFEVYPGSSKDFIYVKAPFKESFELSLTNMAGQLIKHQFISSSNEVNRIAVSDLKAGIYIMRVYSRSASGSFKIHILN